MYAYMSAATVPLQPGDGAIVFGRQDTRVADAAATAHRAGIAHYLIFSGSAAGKDSGDLARQGLTEASYLAQAAAAQGVPVSAIYLEEEARNGVENSRLSLDLIQAKKLPHKRLTVVAHATALRRLAEMLETELVIRGVEAEIQRIPSDYPFDPENPMDIQELANEIVHLSEWPRELAPDGTYWLRPQPDLPPDFVTAAQSILSFGS
jgi:uncharacterized SAM-binding protein YcdF (DUF218 family)